MDEVQNIETPETPESKPDYSSKWPLRVCVIGLGVMLAASAYNQSRTVESLKDSGEVIALQRDTINSVSRQRDRLLTLNQELRDAIGTVATANNQLLDVNGDLRGKLRESIQREVKSTKVIDMLSDQVLKVMNLDPKSKPLHFTPHDAKPHVHDAEPATPVAKPVKKSTGGFIHSLTEPTPWVHDGVVTMPYVKAK